MHVPLPYLQSLPASEREKGAANGDARSEASFELPGAAVAIPPGKEEFAAKKKTVRKRLEIDVDKSTRLEILLVTRSAEGNLL